MRLIDADKLLENIEKRIKGAKSLAEVVDLTNIECITDVQQSVPAVPLDRIKEAREEMAQLSNVNPTYWIKSDMVDREDALEILDNLIAEVEG